ncbi:CD151 antigen-like isoform X2 [Eriocheir sinensis]|uniref:CD151 antigen-like isoform X2 n=1 Tax=Eriocheir sinensis TaxID=95602 RepID=UPI0021C9B22E|nr:CD151 antigen-like isoform X2 [Eriocheir sinensis]
MVHQSTNAQSWLIKQIEGRTTPQYDFSAAASVSSQPLLPQLQCCGVNNYTDFQQATLWQNNKSSNAVVPEACCKLEGDPRNFLPEDPSCPSRPSQENSYYLTGCYGRLMQWIENHTNVLMGIGIGVGITQLLGLCFAFCLCSALGRKVK